jgi:HAD superfamily phosphoserine phosphatase-like hydrolase
MSYNATPAPDFDSVLEHFEYADREAVAAKLAAFSLRGLDRTHLLLDFDRTLTVGRDGTDDDATTWGILRKHLPAEGQERYVRAYQHYRPMETSGLMTEALAREWSGGILDLFAEYQVYLPAIEQDFLSTVAMRPGADGLLEFSQARAVPAVVLSAGIKDVIDILLRSSGVEAALVLSTELTLDASGRIAGWKKDTLINTHNKHEAGHPELTQIRTDRPQCILAGDGIMDVTMADGDADVLRIRILDPRPDEKATSEQLRSETFERFDLAISGGSLEPITLLMQAIDAAHLTHA